MAFNFLKTLQAAKVSKVDLSDPEYKVVSNVSQKEEDHSHHPNPWHRKLEGTPAIFAVFTLIAVFIGGPFEFVPLTLIKSNVPENPAIKPYSSLELAGRDIYIREGLL